MELGKKIRQLRFKAGLTQEQLAEKLGIGAQAVSKWENAVAMPDITLLPLLAEIFGVSIDDLFDLTVEQRFNRIENRMDVEEELPQDVFWEYEEFLKTQLARDANRKRATELIAYLYWHRMYACAQKVRRYAKEAVRLSPGEKGCQWMLNMAEGHAVWDWNIANHNAAIAFYGELVKEHPDMTLPYLYLLDNLIADHRADEAEQALNSLCALSDANPVTCEVYRAHIALARFDEKKADQIMEKLLSDHPAESGCLFEMAQYCAKKCDYQKAIGYYEQSFEQEKRRPRFQDELQGIADIFEIMGESKKAAETYGRIVNLLENEWGMTEETELKNARKKQAAMLAKA
ncbi:MAG: helix-turn-helix domain-containing protein [Clostridia bacterium]|nr:helix-turn-helix domain-containing protein [Clostridia bacterium]